MTGIAFMHILKFKEIEGARNSSRSKNKNGKGGSGPKNPMANQTNDREGFEEVNGPKNLKHSPVNL